MRTMKRSRSLALLVLALLSGSVLGGGVLLAEPLVVLPMKAQSI